ncbi:MAG: hypothetical protein KC519_13045 [Anaerolineae bacterium]|nr:hypothetical protein [Anaerolineae bacterium]
MNRRLAALGVLVMMIFAACQTAPIATPDPFAGVVEAKLLATVAISPTPDESERQATAAAIALLPTQVRATLIPSQTPYIGVFLGELDDSAAPQPAPDSVILVTPVPLTAATVTAQSCAIPPDDRFGTNWRAETAVTAALGCAGEPAATFQGTIQLFENGFMVFIPGGEIWAFAQGVPSGRYWYSAQTPPPAPEDIVAPEGLRVPTLGFGAVWASLPGLRQALGFARTEESSANIIIQRFIGGLLIFDESAGQTFALLGNNQPQGSVYGPY